MAHINCKRDNKLNEVSETSDISRDSFWKFLKRVRKSRGPSTSPPLRKGDTVAESDEDKAKKTSCR
jgi:hypothetical protein